jgi:ankyrin repeat protein
VQRGNWNAVQEFLSRHPGSEGLKITISGGTALHVAVDTRHGHIVKKLVAIMSEQELEVTDKYGKTALFNTIDEGNYYMAECMLTKNENLARIKSTASQLPVVSALLREHNKLARYLYSLTPKEDLKPEKGTDGATLCCHAIYTRSLGKNSTSNYLLAHYFG